MKLTVDRLGRIEHADIEIKPLTVFLGENGTGKTWTAYALYGLLRSLSRARSSKISLVADWPADLTTVRTEVWRRATASPAGQVSATIDAPDPSVESQFVIGGGEIAALLALEHGVIGDARVEFTGSVDEWPGALKRLQFKLQRGGALLSWTGERVDGSMTEEHQILTDGTERSFVAHLDEAMTKRIDTVVVLPAERKALATFALTGGPAPVAITDYVDMLKAAQAAPDRNGDWPADRLAKCLGGSLDYVGDLPVTRRLSFQAGSVDLPLHGAHSLVRAVAGLWAFVKKLAQAGDWLIIDELEMNAHPRAQLALVEFMALLVKRGLRIVFTTHSPYIAEHLNNLLEASRVPAERQAALAQNFQLQTPDAFIGPDQVAVHWFRAQDADDPDSPVQVESALRDGLIDAATFRAWSAWQANVFGDVLRAEEP